MNINRTNRLLELLGHRFTRINRTYNFRIYRFIRINSAYNFLEFTEFIDLLTSAGCTGILELTDPKSLLELRESNYSQELSLMVVLIRDLINLTGVPLTVFINKSLLLKVWS